jgi:benzoyl-CoA reductase subunit D
MSDAERRPDAGAMLAVGIDVGSAAIKLALVEDRAPGGARLLGSGSERVRRRDPLRLVEELFERVLGEVGVSRSDLGYVATTGEGEAVAFRTGHFYGMTAHARGALHLVPAARAVVDVGALHARAILVDDKAKVLGHRMTSQCASGSGQFLENIARYLGVTLDEIGALSLQADTPEPCSSICAVLAETDVINMVSRGLTIPNILKGIHQSMAGRYLRLLTSAGARGVVLVSGGLAADIGLLAALREAAAAQQAPIELMAHEHSVLAGALGAALWGAFRARKLSQRGLSLSQAAPA